MNRLMLDLGIIKLASPGIFHLLPLGIRALEKLKSLIDKEMHKINAQRLALPALTPAELWEKTELFTLTDRHKNLYILSPTHEEAITDLLASIAPLSYKNFPLRLYQITSKYRDEMKSRFGLMRGRQFLMKDLYTFDIDMENAEQTYSEIIKSYENILTKLGIGFSQVLAATGNIGGLISHEFHYTADVGEDKLLFCSNCNYKGNVEISGQDYCPQCKSTKIIVRNGIEVAHTFLLGDKYSKSLNATYLDRNGLIANLQMGCYGLGISRILGAAVEVLSLEQELRWPLVLAPYKVVIIAPKGGSKEEVLTSGLDQELYDNIDKLDGYTGNILLDDRNHLTIGKRYLEARRMGYPYIIVIGSKATETNPLYELNEILTNKQHFLDKNELLQHFRSIQ
ncbi:mitochondrial ribosome protein l39/prolyl-trna ligase family member [Holotrichia oblita]|uniref:Mitochondrial ribosome protein l39/prolyl-trna ligase family member n=1 Tax=Holotrichia oblita TaxID=644536 RepID=A0ACB9SS56_HOLOL|nr:mitochondrial ribosome protein l39/prolyl-trna ligase family member [Holotrichia oblita]